MGDRCEVHLVRYDYQPGDTINGKVDCFFSQEQTVRNIKIRLKGRAKVRWSQGKNNHHSADEVYFNEESNLLLCETKFTPGTYTYPFNFTLSSNLPTSLSQEGGTIKYNVKAIVDKAWAIDYTSKKEFRVTRVMNLNLKEHLREPFVFMEDKIPTSLIPKIGQVITVFVKLSKKAFVPGEMVAFQARIKNNCSFQVKQVIFRIAHGFELIADASTKTINTDDNQHFAIIDSDIPPQSEKTWDLELMVLPNVFAFSTEPCRIIRPFCELKGEVCLPLLHKNIKISIPIVVGTVPFANK